MKALTLWQPWASLVAAGGKRWETRSWGTSYRGPLMIHAAKAPVPYQLEEDPVFAREAAQVLGTTDWNHALPFGAIVAVADLAAVLPVEDGWSAGNRRERIFGDWSVGRYVWKLENVRRLARPVPAAGGRRLWTPSAAIQASVTLATPVLG